MSTATGQQRSADELRLLPIRHVWLQTQNSAALADAESNTADIGFTWRHEHGNYALPTMPITEQTLAARIEGYRRFGAWSLYGSMSYNVQALEGLRWRYNVLASAGNPFTLGDSIRSDADAETFAFSGGIAHESADGKLAYGVGINYTTAGSADQNDPRPLTTGTRYGVKPGLTYRFGRWRLGAAAYVEGYRENIDVHVEQTGSIHNFFLFMGMGQFYPGSGSTYTRKYQGHRAAGSLQVAFDFATWLNLLEIEAERIAEQGRDGNALRPFRSGDYQADRLTARYLLTARTDRITHLLRLNASAVDAKGIWYDQRIVPSESGTTEWLSYNRSIRWKQQQITLAAHYQLLKMAVDGCKSFDLGGAVVYELNNEHLYPNLETMAFRNLTLAVDASKKVRLPNDYDVLVEGLAGWRTNLTRRADFGTLALKNELSSPAFQYSTVDNLHASFGFTVARPFQVADVQPLLPYLKAIATIQYPLGQYNDRRMWFSITAGLVF